MTNLQEKTEKFWIDRNGNILSDKEECFENLKDYLVQEEGLKEYHGKLFFCQAIKSISNLSELCDLRNKIANSERFPEKNFSNNFCSELKFKKAALIWFYNEKGIMIEINSEEEAIEKGMKILSV